MWNKAQQPLPADTTRSMERKKEYWWRKWNREAKKKKCVTSWKKIKDFTTDAVAQQMQLCQRSCQLTTSCSYIIITNARTRVSIFMTMQQSAEKYQFLHDHLPRWPMLPFHNNSVFRLKSILTSCQINWTELFKGRLLMTSSCCSAVWGCALPDQLEGPPSAGGLPAPRRSCHLTSPVSCIEHAALWEKWLITITSCAGSRRLILLHTHSLSLSLQIPPSLTALLSSPFAFPVQLYKRSMWLSGHLFI